MSSFRAVAGPADLVGEGRRYVVGRCFCYWQDGTRASGTFMFGKPLEADIAQMTEFWQLGVDHRFAGRAVFIDARDVDSVDALAFKRLLSYLLDRERRVDHTVGSMNMVHGGGLVGVITAGLLNVVRPPYPFRATNAEDARQAFETAGVGDLFELVDELRRRFGRVPEIVRSVQSVLKREPDIEAADLALKLNLSPRTLQRRLEEVGSSLRVERRNHLMREAEELLASTALDLDAIAARLGLASASHLVTLFRRVHGVTPGEWREQNRP
ncbi:MAG: AraC family transcriptional regulator [Archangium sp.]